MSALAARQAAPPAPIPAPSRLLQRACACGGSAGLTGTCSNCEHEKRFGSSGLQPKLQLSAPGDVYEQEADRIADEVVSLPGPGPFLGTKDDVTAAAPALHRKILPLVQRQESPGEDEETLPGLSDDAGIETEAAGEESDDETKTIQPRRMPDADEADTGPAFQARLEAEHIGGRPLAEDVRSDMESRFGVDLGHVRVHTGARSAELARSIHAQAFTLGSHVYFGEGYYDPGSKRGRHLLAHELTHTVQQARGAMRLLPPEAQQPAAPASEAPPTVQRSVEDSFVPERVPSGDLVHAEILEELGEINPNLFTEVKIPGAMSVGLSDNAGRADLYMDVDDQGKSRKAPTTPAVIMIGDTPEYLSSFANPRVRSTKGISRLLKGGKNFEHKALGAPRGVEEGDTACDDKPGVKVCRLDKAPKRILLGDLKPPPSLENFLGGTIQISNYESGIRDTKDRLNEFIRQHPDQADPLNTTWSPTTDKITKLRIPKVRNIRSKDATKLPLRLYDNRKEDIAIADLRGHLAVYKAKEAGIWQYEWIPEKIPARLRKGGTSERVTKALTRLNELVRQVRAPPVETPGAKKALPGAPPRRTPTPPRPAPARIQRKETFDKDKWPGEFKTWQETHAVPLLGSDAVGPVGKLGVQTPQSEEAKALRVFEGVKDLKSRVPAEELPADLAQLPSLPAAATGGIKKLQLWARWGSLIGRLRVAMGGVFVKIANLYEKAKERFDRARGAFTAKEPSSGGSIGKAIVSGVFRVATTFFKILVDRISAELKRSMKHAATVIVEDLVGEDRLNTIAEAKEDFETMVAGVQAKVDAEVENVRALTEPYEKIFETLSDVQKSISDIMRLVSAVRWGLRIIQCVTPPGLGCLKLLLQAVVEELAAKVISSCWFVLNFIKPMLTKFDIFTNLPGQISGFILEQVKKIAGLLPVTGETLDKAFPPVTVRTGMTATDLECDDKVITPAQREMNKLLDKYGEAKIREMIKVLEAAGMTTDREMTIADVKILGGLLDKIESGEVTMEDIQNAVVNLKAGKGSGVPNIDDAISQLSGLGGSGGGHGPGKGGTGSGTGGGIRRVPFDQAKTKIPPAGGTVAGTKYRATGSKPDHVAGQAVTIGLAGFVNNRQIAEITDVPATVEEVRDITVKGVPHCQPFYRITSTIRFDHDVPGVGSFVADPAKLVPGTAFPVAGNAPPADAPQKKAELVP
ncbi:DUF4157 domain-containing protein [Microvirga sp. BSC39]|uniref:eCIS core domain-containing protein n=1 Tax=Microvirga sp. BSC39 TaxID=1549810 RepID=UPI0004E8B4DC|nr:DUF4157 domain-containing protein [Microvirga sp. BSC39]KFG69595.1 hypothetical protein JH26_09735 [Microvirga sp. BSC39]